MSNRMMQCCIAVVLAIATTSQPVHAQSIYQRRTTTKATIVGSHNIYDGTFIGTGVANMCGIIPKESSMTGTATFVIEYAYDDPGSSPGQSISVGSSQLVGNTPKATLFRL